MLSSSIIPTPTELRQAAAIERRRQNEEARRCRIFDEKTRQIGSMEFVMNSLNNTTILSLSNDNEEIQISETDSLRPATPEDLFLTKPVSPNRRTNNIVRPVSNVDIKALEEQIKEKERLSEDEKRLEQAYTEQKQSEDQLLKLFDRHTELQKKKITNEIRRFRLCNQRFEDRREFDLNDPNYLKNATICQSAEDASLGISSMQKFEGEDLCKSERLKLQAEQKRAWYIQQSHEKQKAEEERRRGENEYMKAIVARDQRAIELERLERECRARMDAAQQELNRAIAEQIKSRRRTEEMQDYEDTQAHLFNVMTSDMMTENVECGISSLGPGRIIPTMYRGLSAEQKAELKKSQLQQAQAKRAEMEEEKQKDAQWDALAADLARSVQLKEREMKRNKMLLQAKIKEENLVLGEIQREQRQKFNEYARSFPTREYFDQFGTSTR